jgi:hypothetical protein
VQGGTGLNWLRKKIKQKSCNNLQLQENRNVRTISPEKEGLLGALLIKIY